MAPWYATLAQRQAMLRFACGSSAAFAMSEWMGWYPTFLAPILTATLLANLPGPLPLKGGIFLLLVQTVGAFAAFALASLLRETPSVLVGSIGLVLFLSFSMIARGRHFFPILLVLICFSTIPVVTMASPDQAGALPTAFIRGMGVALAFIWLVQGIWPLSPAKTAAASARLKVPPLYLAIAGTAIVLPLMLVYLMYGLTDSLPVLITTVVLVVNFDASRGALQGFAMILANFIGGLVAIAGHSLLAVAPSLFTLACMTFGIALLFARRIERGGSTGPVALITFNQSIIMLSLGLMPGPSSSGIWATRLLQFAIAYGFAVGMMYLLLPRETSAVRPSSSRHTRAHA